MGNDAYTKELRKILTDKSPATATTKTRIDLQSDIAVISRLLAGPLSNFERLNLLEDRAQLRKQLAALDS